MSSHEDFDLEKQAVRAYSPNEQDSNDNNTFDGRTQISRIEHSIHDDGREVLLIGDTKVYKDEFVRAFGGTLNPGISVPTKISKEFAVAGPLGLSAFALTTFVLSLINAQAMGVDIPNVVASVAFFYGGVVQLLAGMWEFPAGNTFAACAFSSYGGFWISYGALITDAFGISAAYEAENATGQLSDAIGFYLLGWAIFTFMLWLCTIRSTWAFTSLFFFLFVTFLLLAVGQFTGEVGCTRAGGVVGIVVAFISWYNAYAGLATKSNTYITIKPWYLPGAE
ncbi:Ady2 protein [Saccharomycopsis crataegensis]|uniref:Ady2 protein n=1 Tax=Saccharomycopsis crataegensis TaxID=43959 RepID=A0AAV5QDX6_9ASCO|nr:Ady2 protein [Saccharomycopsis crataegensis]